MTVCENVMYPLKLLRHSDADAKKEAQIALEKVGLGESYWKRLPAMLSGGEQQRVAIARTLAVHAQIVLADEPTGNLDTENSSQIIQLLSKLAHEETCCVVVVTHDLEVAKAADVVFRCLLYTSICEVTHQYFPEFVQLMIIAHCGAQAIPRNLPVQFCLCCCNAAAVSYTHLDVYKRQY